jgi:hypothetical protein
MNPDFERAFVATRYFLGARSVDLAAPLRSHSKLADELCERLALGDRARRAETLAGEVGRIVRALEAKVLR